MENRQGSLCGVKVIDLSRMLPGPYCSMVLADHGADVVAIEDRRFAADDLFFSTLYRNKKHLCLNLKMPQGREIFFRLLKDADVLIEGFRPGVTQRLGVDYETLQEVRPELIYCSITGYGQTGPDRLRAGHDVNYLSMAGILDLIGPRNGPPTIPGVQIADIFGGAMQAVSGILLALFARERTGRGQYIDISMTDGLLGLLCLPSEIGNRKGRMPHRADNLLSHHYACYNVYRTSDNRFVAVGALENRFWTRLCILLGLPHYAGVQYDEQCREEMIEALRGAFLNRSAREWEKLLAEEDVCCSVVRTLEEVVTSPQFIERDMVVAGCKGSESEGPQFGIPIKLSDTPGTIRSMPDSFGGSSEQILYDLGYSAGQIAELREQNVI